MPRTRTESCHYGDSSLGAYAATGPTQAPAKVGRMQFDDMLAGNFRCEHYRMNSPSHDSPNSGRALLKQLEQQFEVFRKGLPVAIGIDKEIVKRIPDVDRKLLRAALGIHTHSTRYLNALVKAKTRFDLDGNPAGEILESHRILAADTLKARKKKIAEQRIEQERMALEEQERIKRDEKLRQLAEKFGPRR